MLEFLYSIYMIFLYIGIFVALFLGFWIFNPNRKLTIIRRLTGKNLGYLEIILPNKAKYKVNVDFNKSRIKVGTRSWLMEKGKIYRLLGDGTKGTEKAIDPTRLSFDGGLPVLHVDLNDLRPLRLESDAPTGVNSDPAEIEAAIETEVLAATLEARKMAKDEIMKKINIAILVGVICIAMTGFCIVQIMGVQSNVNQGFAFFNSTLTPLKDQVYEIHQTVVNRPLIVGGI